MFTEIAASPYCCGAIHVTSMPSGCILSSLNGGLNGGAVGVTESTFEASLAIKLNIVSSSEGN